MSAILQEIIRVGLYKPSQGRITRQLTCGALWALVLWGAWHLHGALTGWEPGFHFGLGSGAFTALWVYAIPGLVAAAGCWIAYRVVNLPNFADFLIAVEAEMNKVSWPSRGELTRASIVVLVTIFSLAGILAVYDLLCYEFFHHVIHLF